MTFAVMHYSAQSIFNSFSIKPDINSYFKRADTGRGREDKSRHKARWAQYIAIEIKTNISDKLTLKPHFQRIL